MSGLRETSSEVLNPLRGASKCPFPADKVAPRQVLPSEALELSRLQPAASLRLGLHPLRRQEPAHLPLARKAPTPPAQALIPKPVLRAIRRRLWAATSSA